jgi:hypothetical protein
MLKTGFTSINSKLNYTSYIDLFQNNFLEINSKLFNVRVKDIILDNTHPKFELYGGWSGIGTIEFEELNTPNPQKKHNSIAVPLLPNIKHYPLVNEIVLLLKLNNKEVNSDVKSEKFYYLSVLNLWNHPHHNAYPNIYDILGDSSQNKNYKEIQDGSIKRIKNTPTSIDLNSPEIGGTFVEKINIHPIQPYAGDYIIEGRFGNTIRLGNTSKDNNNWSTKGENGDPITILRNGQPEDVSDEGWIPVTEDINKDLSSIYLTSKQSIPLNLSSRRYNALKTQPEDVREYLDNQVILNSNRLILNSKKDGILLSSPKYISLSSEDEIGLTSKNKITLYSPQVKLGDKEANQSLILGDKYMEQFKQLLSSLDILCKAIENEPQLTASPIAAAGVRNVIKTLKTQLPSFLSKTSKTL